MGPWLTWRLIITVINALVAALFGFANGVTTYQAGTHWAVLQLISTHFTHLNEWHLLSNLAALFILNALFPQPARTLLWAYFCCVVMTAGYVTFTGITTFLGFSAMLYCHPGAYLVLTVKRGQ
jgi:membrane associated rhomboid family serine protease